ncbi:hypothetical protein MRB53_028323 [Persea americana]|uniref:Uncharacterized protein n=1 Tax=Persea americana TaxID=3435 RepID=A0ACC2KF84_PERAE|nr:hypothetical protein MRB53_028323 [Persea americana]
MVLNARSCYLASTAVPPMATEQWEGLATWMLKRSATNLNRILYFFSGERETPDHLAFVLGSSGLALSGDDEMTMAAQSNRLQQTSSLYCLLLLRRHPPNHASFLQIITEPRRPFCFLQRPAAAVPSPDSRKEKSVVLNSGNGNQNR